MIIRIILIVAGCALLLWFLRQRISTRSQAWSKMAALLLFVLAVVAIISPGITNRLAHLVGVGRGADLLLYTLTVIFLANLLVQHMRRQDEQSRLIQLNRRVAISDANQMSLNQQKISKLKNETARPKSH